MVLFLTGPKWGCFESEEMILGVFSILFLGNVLGGLMRQSGSG